MSNIRFEAQQGPFDRQKIRLRYISHSRFGEDWHSTPHSHRFTEFFYLLAGAGQFHVEDLRIPVQPLDVLVVNPQVTHTETSSQAEPMEYIVLGLEGGEFLLRDSGDARYSHFASGGAGKTLRETLEQMEREMQKQDPFYTDAVQSLLELFLIQLLRAVGGAQLRQEDPNQNLVCNNVRHYIDTHYDENITLDSLAQLAHLNKYYLAHMFTKENGVSPIHYLLRRRIQESRYFLTNTSHSVSQISQFLGFSSPSYFSQCFRKAEGMSPSEYRLQNAPKADITKQ